MDLVINPFGALRMLYDERLDLSGLGGATITRASYVEPGAGGRWTADMAPVGGPRLGPFDRRSEALAAEQRWLAAHWLLASEAP